MKGRNQNNAENLLREIIEFNRNRILSRLRSLHALTWKTKNKPPIINSLAKALVKLRVLDKTSAATLEGLERIIQDMVTQFDGLEKMEKHQAQSPKADKFLLCILRHCNYLVTEYRLNDILSTIPHGDDSFSEERKTSLVERIRKLGRYIKLGPIILRFARRLAIFRKITVHGIKIRSTVSDGPHALASEKMPRGLLDQYLQDPSSALGQKIAQVESRIKSNLVDTQADLRQKSLRTKRIHAEMQLLFHYEQRPKIKLKPRVICSSKNACFLCNTFMRLHNQFYTPKTHGNLYPLWTLPTLSTLSLARSRIQELRKLYIQLNTLIEEMIISCLETRSSVQIYNNESMILHVHSLTASEVSAAEEITDKPMSNDARSLSIKPSPDSNSILTGALQNNIDNESPAKGASKPSTSCNLGSVQGLALSHAVNSSPTTENSKVAIEESTDKPIFNNARRLPTNRILIDTLQNNIDNEGPAKGSSKSSTPRPPDSIHGSALCHSVGSSSNTQNSKASATPPTKAMEIDVFESTLHTAIPKTLEPKRLLPGQAVWSFMSLSSPPTRFHTSSIHAELSYDHASSMSSLNSLVQQDPNLPGKAGRELKVCAIWLTATEAEKVGGAPGEVDMANDWTWKKLDRVFYSPDGLVLRKGGEVLKLSAEEVVL